MYQVCPTRPASWDGACAHPTVPPSVGQGWSGPPRPPGLDRTPTATISRTTRTAAPARSARGLFDRDTSWDRSVSMGRILPDAAGPVTRGPGDDRWTGHRSDAGRSVAGSDAGG